MSVEYHVSQYTNIIKELQAQVQELRAQLTNGGASGSHAAPSSGSSGNIAMYLAELERCVSYVTIKGQGFANDVPQTKNRAAERACYPEHARQVPELAGEHWMRGSC